MIFTKKSEIRPVLTTHRINIAIDGYSSCGKGTLARFLAQKLKYIFIDTGAMYRAVGLYFLRQNLEPEIENDVQNALKNIRVHFEFLEGDFAHIHLNGEDVEQEIRSIEVASMASRVAAIPVIRKYLVVLQREIAKDKGVVMDGRDIGTVVLPNAELKIFMTARPEIRAQRRFAELERAGVHSTYQDVLKNLTERDARDSEREDSPLKFTNQYHLLDNSDLGIDQQNEIALRWVASLL